MSDVRFSVIQRAVQAILNALNAIGSSTVPAPTVSNQKSGNYAYSSLGSPSISSLTANLVQYSNPFAPAGERVSFMGGYFKTGGINLGPDAYVFLECDLSGGVSYKPVSGSKRILADNVDSRGANYPGFVVNYELVRGGNYRFGICFGTTTGTATGNTGYNIGVLN